MVTDLRTDLRGRGLDTTRPILVGINCGKALHAAVTAVFDHPVIQCCQMHKLRNVADKLPDDLAKTVTKEMRAAYHAPSAILAEAQLQALARGSEHTQHELHRVKDLDLPQPLDQREELAERRHGPTLVRRRPGRGRQAVPPRQRPPAPASAASRPPAACR